MRRRLKQSLTFSGIGVGGEEPEGHRRQSHMIDQAFGSAKKRPIIIPIRPRISLIAACRSSASFVNRVAANTILDGSLTPAQSNANAFLLLMLQAALLRNESV